MRSHGLSAIYQCFKYTHIRRERIYSFRNGELRSPQYEERINAFPTVWVLFINVLNAPIFVGNAFIRSALVRERIYPFRPRRERIYPFRNGELRSPHEL